MQLDDLPTEGEPDKGLEDRPRRELHQSAFGCPRCGAFAHMNWSMVGISHGPTGTRSFDDTSWDQATCARCHLPSVWRGEQMVYPRTRLGAPAHKDMPGEVRELYEEAAAVAAVSRRAGAALARATVEVLIKHLDPSARRGTNLDRRIERIKERGVSTPLGEMLDVVRVTGNGALHVDDQPGELVVLALDDQDGPQLLDLLLEVANDLVDELITRPKTTRGLWNKLPAGVKDRLARTSEGIGTEGPEGGSR